MVRHVTPVDFVAAGSPLAVFRAIEACADEQHIVSALVVPWQSTRDVLSVAVTSARVDGWAIEHTNLGTVRLTDLGNERTRVEVFADDPSTSSGHSEALEGRATSRGEWLAPQDEKLTRMFEEFVRQIRKRFEVGL
jgi:hypothetical protein